MFKLILSVTLLLQLLLETECLFSGESCIAEGDYGVCIPLIKCKALIAEIRRVGNPMPSYMRDKLQGLTCGYELYEPMVCCVLSDPFNQDSDWGSELPQSESQEVTRPYTSRPTSSETSNSVTSGENPDNTDYVESFTRKTVEDRSGPPNVEGHRNLDLLPRECGAIESDRIWGGNRTRLFEMPWMILLSYDSGRGVKLSCGGTIINKWYIMTAAHCVSFLNGMRLDGVIIGEYDIRTDPDCEITDGEEICAPNVMNGTIDSVIVHPKYSPQKWTDDIALIRLAQPADFKLDSVKPICLPITRQLQMQSLVGVNGVVAGWGITEDGLQSPVLLSVDLPIVPYKECQADYNGSLRISRTQICAGGVKDKDSCGGDSGGPLMYPGLYGKLGLRYIQRGIVAFGSKRCGIAGFPGVYTNVAYYMDWILDNIHS